MDDEYIELPKLTAEESKIKITEAQYEYINRGNNTYEPIEFQLK